jgi:DNA (cytosine-5)-methyltransferase 1
MRYGSVCSGIEAATMAWHPLGWEAQWFSEIEPFPSAVLQHHYPQTPNLGDMTLIHSNPIFNETTIDVLVGGTPCQSFSVAGLRKGMEDSRGNLALEFCRIADKAKPQWIVWENVPGVLSSNGGKDFGSLLGALGELGYGFAYRVLDAQYFGVAQRRRRVFLIGYLGDWRPAAAVLFESESLCRDIAESRSKRQKVTRAIEGSSTPYRKSSRATTKDGLETWVEDQVSNTLNCFDVGDVRSTMSVVTQKNIYENHPNDSRVKEMGETSSTVTSRWGTGGGNTPIVSETTALCFKVRGGVSENSGTQGGVIGKSAGKGYLGSEEKSFTIATAPDQWLFEDKKTIVLDRASFNQGQNAQYDAKIEESNTTPTLVARGPHAVFALAENTIGRQPLNGGNGDGFTEGGPMYTLNASGVHGVAVDMYNMSINEQTSQTLSSSASDINHTGGTIQNAKVRRLTPVECERLQGFPDNFTNIPYRKKEESPDGPRYKALGNSMAVPVMAWIGKRIQEVSEIINEQNNVNKK